MIGFPKVLQIGLLVVFSLTCGLSSEGFARKKSHKKPRVLPFKGFSKAPDAIADKVWEPQPFWRKKSKVWKRMQEDRLLVVSAKTDTISEKPKRYEMSVKAAGIVSAPFEFCKKWANEFEKLPLVDDRFKKVTYYPDTQRLYIHSAAYGFHAKMILKIQKAYGDRVFELRWRVVEGTFLGMIGTIRVDEVRQERVEISLRAKHTSGRILLPPILLNFGLEVVGQRVAGKMRSYIEKEYKKGGS